MSKADPDRINVPGSIHIGQEFELVEQAEPSRAGSFLDAGQPDDMQAIDYTPLQAPVGELSMQRLTYSLTPKNTELYIQDDGLTASYGIFGAPGSGKTYLALYLLYQILALHKEDDELKYGGLILDPKAALIEDVQD